MQHYPHSWRVICRNRAYQCYINYSSFICCHTNKRTRQLPKGAGHCHQDGLTDRNTCNMHGARHRNSGPLGPLAAAGERVTDGRKARKYIQIREGPTHQSFFWQNKTHSEEAKLLHARYFILNKICCLALRPPHQQVGISAPYQPNISSISAHKILFHLY